MTLGHRLDDALRAGPNRVEADGRVAEVDVAEVDRLGVRVRGVRVRGEHSPDPERVMRALQPLPERLVPVEVAPTLGGATLRSDPREMRGGEYFEARSRGPEVELDRWRAIPGGREPRTFDLTREQLRRVVDELADALGVETG